MKYLHLDGTVLDGGIIGSGGSGLIIQEDQVAVKIPRLWLGVDVAEDGRLTPDPDGYDMRQFRIDQILREKAIFRRLGAFSGIVPCSDLVSLQRSIRMTYMKHGDLRNYLARVNPSPDKKTKLNWLRQMAQTLALSHRCRVIVADLRSDNTLVDDDLSVKFTDFGDSTLMPLDWDMQEPDEYGKSASTDVGNFGAVMFEIITGKHRKFDLMQAWKEPGGPLTWPRRESLPPTEGLWLGHIVEACWAQGLFNSADGLAAELDRQRVEP